MGKKRGASSAKETPRWYNGADIPMRVIRRFAREVAQRFDPDKIVLFGSYAYGTPHEDSDVDLLVIMPCRNQLDQGLKIRCALEAPFPMDLIVRTPKEMKWRLEEGDSFLTEIVSKGRLLYQGRGGGTALQLRTSKDGQPRERDHEGRLTREWLSKAEGAFITAHFAHGMSAPSHAHVCLHCRRAAELYLKALVQELGLPVPRTDTPLTLLPLLLAHFPCLGSLRRGLAFLAHFTEEITYPGRTTSKRQAEAALRWAGRVRTEVRALLGIRPPRRKKSS
jgi:predicted nucleotidyltransferase/HEPN domain-containing protein